MYICIVIYIYVYMVIKTIGFTFRKASHQNRDPFAQAHSASRKLFSKKVPEGYISEWPSFQSLGVLLKFSRHLLTELLDAFGASGDRRSKVWSAKVPSSLPI